MRCLLIAMLLLLCAPLWANVTLKLKGEDREFNAEIVRVDGESVTYLRGRRESTARLADFELPSVYRIKAAVASGGDDWLNLARFALHRALYAKAIEAAERAATRDGALHARAERIKLTAQELHADTLVEQIWVLLDDSKPDEARQLLEFVIERYPDTAGAERARILQSTVTRVELEIRARELAEKAREAQTQADADEQDRRKHIDDWIEEFRQQIEQANELRRQGDSEAANRQVSRAISRYTDASRILLSVRQGLADGRRHMVYRGQNETADEIDRMARNRLVTTYDNWAHQLFMAGLYDQADDICTRGLKLDPGNRRLLLLKVDLDEARHGMNR
jgi:tetratricopeptide (TPR) repeat protein